jgi:hypothetical protein
MDLATYDRAKLTALVHELAPTHLHLGYQGDRMPPTLPPSPSQTGSMRLVEITWQELIELPNCVRFTAEMSNLLGELFKPMVEHTDVKETTSG